MNGEGEISHFHTTVVRSHWDLDIDFPEVAVHAIPQMGSSGLVTFARGNSDNEVVHTVVDSHPGVLESEFFCEVLLWTQSTEIVNC